MSDGDRDARGSIEKQISQLKEKLAILNKTGLGRHWKPGDEISIAEVDPALNTAVPRKYRVIGVRQGGQVLLLTKLALDDPRLGSFSNAYERKKPEDGVGGGNIQAPCGE